MCPLLAWDSCGRHHGVAWTAPWNIFDSGVLLREDGSSGRSLSFGFPSQPGTREHKLMSPIAPQDFIKQNEG